MTAKRDQIIETAYQLFSTNGFYATGVDLIMQTAGISKRTMYKYFPTKINLIIAVLDYYRETYIQKMSNLLDQNELSAKEKIMTIFGEVQSWNTDQSFHGCPAVNAMGEFEGKDKGIEQSCHMFKERQLQILNTLCQQMGANKPDELAYKLFVLMEGMASIAMVRKKEPPIDIKDFAEQLIEEELTKETL